MKEIIQRIVNRIRFSYPIMIEESITKILEEELPDFNPYKIDEERFKRIYGSKIAHIDIFLKEYNSTLPEPLKELPKEMPEDIEEKWNHKEDYGTDQLWQDIISHYGTPASNLQPLPSVEELAKELASLDSNSETNYYATLAQHIHSKYSLKPSEEKGFPFNLKRGDYFIYKCGDGTPISVGDGLGIQAIDGKIYHVDYCTPYTTPTASEIIAKHNLTEEEVRVIREGKCSN